MNNNRFASIGINTLENNRNYRFQRISNSNRNPYNEYINENSVSCHFNKTKILLLLIITIILSLSNFFYNWNNNISIIIDEPKTILSFFDNNIFKYNSLLNEQKRTTVTKIRNLKQETNNTTNNENEKFDIYNKNIKLIKEYEIKKKIFSSLDKKLYKFNWNSSSYKIGDSSYGEGLFSISKRSQVFTDSIRITMKLYEESFIDNWLIHASDTNLEDLDFQKNQNNNIIELTGSFVTTAFHGKFFDLINEDLPMYCQSYYKILFPFNENSNNNNSLKIDDIEKKRKHIFRFK